MRLCYSLLMMKISSGTILSSAIGLVAFFVLVTGLWSNFIGQPGPLTVPKMVVVPAGAPLGRIAHILRQENVIKNPLVFELAVRSMFLQDSLQAGAYLFGGGASVKQVVGKLSTGDVVQLNMTFPEGQTVAEILAKIMENKNLVGEVNMHVPEGYLFPETYAYTHGSTRLSVVQRMQQKAQKELMAAWEGRQLDLPLNSPQELLTLASIIEKETGVNDERDVVASVFVNRLKKGMRLEADPTVIYGASNYNGNITRKHLREDHPYNTYVHAGLPKGPIANPGRASLLAAANPAQTEFLYFVADGEGGHVFAKTYAEHQWNVKEYLKKYRQKLKEAQGNG